tara:strand:+ start:3833 stop:4924 length:1092 start_codon:yes stop_codon:yes gene_type:complete
MSGLIISIKDAARQAVEAATGGRVTIMYDDKGYPCHMVRIPKFNLQDIDPGLGNGVHPAFIVNGVEKSEIWIGQYQAILHDGRALSLPGQDVKTSTNFDQALSYCAAKGAGWHLMTNAEWAAIALWCYKNGTLPNGNNNYGRDYAATWETGTRQDGSTYDPGEATGSARVLSGSGPASWRHDHSFAGIADLNGNVLEWNGGLRLLDGEIQVLADNNAADNTKDQSATSAEWQAIAQDGSLVSPGTAGTLKYDAVGATGTGAVQLDDVVDSQSDGTTSASVDFESLAADAGITVPDRLKQLGLFPALAGLGGDNIWMRNAGERLPIRGGYWSRAAGAGVFALILNNARSSSSSYIGFRPAFVAL